MPWIILKYCTSPVCVPVTESPVRPVANPLERNGMVSANGSRMRSPLSVTATMVPPYTPGVALGGVFNRNVTILDCWDCRDCWGSINTGNGALMVCAGRLTLLFGSLICSNRNENVRAVTSVFSRLILKSM